MAVSSSTSLTKATASILTRHRIFPIPATTLSRTSTFKPLQFQVQLRPIMHAVQVQAWAEGPKLVTVPDPPAASATDYRLKVLGAGLHRVVQLRASGKHYSAQTLPHTPGIDGVGLDESTGKQYYFNNWAPTFGSFAEYVVVPRAQCAEIPAGADGVGIAAFYNPAMSSWMALTKRIAPAPPKDFTVLILGVTSASGALAVPIARAHGAGRIIGAARNVEAARKVAGGVDEVVELKGAETDFSGVECDVVLDYVYGDVAVAFFKTIKTPRPLQYVQIGSLADKMEVSFDVGWVRGKNITVRGSGPGSLSIMDMAVEMQPLVTALAGMTLPSTTQIKLGDVEKVWKDTAALGKGRVVVVP